MRSMLFLLPFCLFLGCDAAPTPFLLPSLDGDWQVIFDANELPTCITITGGRVTAVLSDCVDPQPVISSTEATISGSSVTFSVVLGGVRQTSAGPIAVEMSCQYYGTIQGDGSISANRVLTATLNGTVISAFNDAAIMTRR